MWTGWSYGYFKKELPAENIVFGAIARSTLRLESEQKALYFLKSYFWERVMFIFNWSSKPASWKWTFKMIAFSSDV